MKHQLGMARHHQSGALWTPLADIGSHWQLLAVYWRLLAVIGGYWRLLAVVGGYWQLLAAHGFCWCLGMCRDAARTVIEVEPVDGAVWAGPL